MITMTNKLSLPKPRPSQPMELQYDSLSIQCFTFVMQEFTNTFKQGVADKDGNGKIALESKVKSTFSGTTHECSAKQDGSMSYDLKWDILEVTQANFY